MANRNVCFSDFSKQKNRQGKMTFLSFPCGWPWGISRDAPPPPPESVRTFARSYAGVITKFSRLDGLPIFLTHGASLARFARWSSAINLNSNWFKCLITSLGWVTAGMQKQLLDNQRFYYSYLSMQGETSGAPKIWVSLWCQVFR